MKEALRKTGYDLLNIEITEAKGCYIYDEQGNKYLDFESGVWCCALGHNNSNVNNGIKSQLDKITHTGYTFINRLANKTSAKILDVLDIESGKCSLLSSGTEAVELAVKIGRAVSDNKLILVLSDQYFGSYGSAMRKEKDEFYTFDYSICQSCKISDECDLSCKNFQNIPFDKINTFLFEPGGKGGLALFPPSGLVRNIEKVVAKNSGYIVVNEVTTGLGRTGEWFGFQHYNLKPDIVAMGKILGNGYPVSAVALNSRVSDELDKREFYYGQSHTNDPLSSVVASIVVDTLSDEKLVERSRDIGSFFLNELIELKAESNLINEVRGRGLLLCIEFNNHLSDESLLKLYHQLIENGYILGLIKSRKSIRFMPPFILTETEIKDFISCLKELLYAYK